MQHIKKKIMKKIIILTTALIISFTTYAQFASKDPSLFKNFQNGQVIASDNGTLNNVSNFRLTKEPYDLNMVGVYVDKEFKPDTNKAVQPIPPNKYVATSGIVEVRYNSENGNIKKGDPITSSSTSGEAMKATKSGIILGFAVEDAKADKGIIKARILIQYLKQ